MDCGQCKLTFVEEGLTILNSVKHIKGITSRHLKSTQYFFHELLKVITSRERKLDSLNKEICELNIQIKEKEEYLNSLLTYIEELKQKACTENE